MVTRAIPVPKGTSPTDGSLKERTCTFLPRELQGSTSSVWLPEATGMRDSLQRRGWRPARSSLSSMTSPSEYARRHSSCWTMPPYIATDGFGNSDRYGKTGDFTFSSCRHIPLIWISLRPCGECWKANGSGHKTTRALTASSMPPTGHWRMSEITCLFNTRILQLNFDYLLTFDESYFDVVRSICSFFLSFRTSALIVSMAFYFLG